MKSKLIVILSLWAFASSAQAELKNVQHILGGLLTRAGVKNQKPLDAQELNTLCEAGYTQAYFFYSGAGDQKINCSGGKSIHYRSMAQGTAKDLIIENVTKGLTTGEKTFIHCNNGAHATGYASAVALRQFCGLSAEQAVKYWNDSLGGYPLQEPNRGKVHNTIRAFTPKMNLNEAQKAALGCEKFK
jgi:hypothetical protein